MDAAQNHYGTFGAVSPMVFLGRHYWTETKPVYAVVEHLARGRQYADALALLDDPRAVIEFIVKHPPGAYKTGSGPADPRPH